LDAKFCAGISLGEGEFSLYCQNVKSRRRITEFGTKLIFLKYEGFNYQNKKIESLRFDNMIFVKTLEIMKDSGSQSMKLSKRIVCFF